MYITQVVFINDKERSIFTLLNKSDSDAGKKCYIQMGTFVVTFSL